MASGVDGAPPRAILTVCAVAKPAQDHPNNLESFYPTGEAPAAMPFDVPSDDLDIIADALRFLVGKAGGIEQLPFDPFAAIERLRGRVLPELPSGWQLRVLPDGEVGLLRQRADPLRCWQVWGEGPTLAAAVADALTKIGPDGFPFNDPEDEGVPLRPSTLVLPTVWGVEDVPLPSSGDG